MNHRQVRILLAAKFFEHAKKINRPIRRLEIFEVGQRAGSVPTPRSVLHLPMCGRGWRSPGVRSNALPFRIFRPKRLALRSKALLSIALLLG